MYEQPLLNYLVDSLPLRAESMQGLLPGLSDSHWPNPCREGRLIRVAERFEWSDDVDPKLAGQWVALLHWAGFQARSGMPFRRLFLDYRLRTASPCERIRYHISQHLKFTPGRVYRRGVESIGRLRRSFVGPKKNAKSYLGSTP
jgi:hypothetical protein